MDYKINIGNEMDDKINIGNEMDDKINIVAAMDAPLQRAPAAEVAPWRVQVLHAQPTLPDEREHPDGDDASAVHCRCQHSRHSHLNGLKICINI
jgi:hypothetical protein